MLHDLQAGIEHVEEMEEGLDNETPFNNRVNVEEDITNVVFKELLNQASRELYLGCSEFSSLNFLVTMVHVKVPNGWSNKSFDMMLELIKRVFPMYAINIPSSFYETKWKLYELDLRYETIHACKYDCAQF